MEELAGNGDLFGSYRDVQLDNTRPSELKAPVQETPCECEDTVE